MDEWATVDVPGLVLSSADQRLAVQLSAAGLLDVLELKDGLRISAGSWVGVVRFECFTVRVHPKLAGDYLGLVEMIEFTSGLRALHRVGGQRSLKPEEGSLVDLIALLLAEACEQLLTDGLLSGYVEREEAIPAVRGRLLVDRQLLRRAGRLDLLECRFDEFEYDIIENQLLAVATARAAAVVSDPQIRVRLRALHSVFDAVCRPDGLDLATARSLLTYHRLNEHYRDAHQLAWLVLDALGVRDLLAPGQTKCFSFMLNMNLLFESFVTRLLERLLAGSGWRVRAQQRDRTILWNAGTNRPYGSIRPDIVVESAAGRRRRVPLDAKYKLFDGHKLGSADIYQGFLYAHACAETGTGVLPTALIVYPASQDFGAPVNIVVRDGRGAATARVTALPLRIKDALAEAQCRSPGTATERLLAELRACLADVPRAAAPFTRAAPDC